MLLGTLHTRRSPSRVCTASISLFCFELDACQASVAIGDGCSDVVVSVCSIVNDGLSAATRIDPLLYLCHVRTAGPVSRHTAAAAFDIASTHPNANDLQSDDGAMEVRGSKMVRAEIDSLRIGSNRITFPMESPMRARAV